ncbi:la-related protein 4 isoform X2 [Boleophthalmus pectinirostris]|uniref:la-related protein 4 isoform X2 n=1 Tax=Boleophthalmus pectinirostris TaxID=150288 RepID=UPI00242E4AAB|nr:la-related protein 4 isoform X2 [Boleophthalmus pectinirostris]
MERTSVWCILTAQTTALIMTLLASEVMGGTCDYPDLGYLVFEPQYNGTVEEEVITDKTLSEETLRESLKKQLEFYFSRENLSKDLYLISQMDSDQFVPIWTIACMEDIKSLTSDLELIVDILKTSPLVQVDESGEKVRPNYSRCIIILREVPETTPVEEVEALFNNENCPKALSAEFAHNSNWYITFQSDNDALQALKYLREEVKVFQGKPIMARIKAINTFFGKSGFHSVDSSVFSQPPPQTQTPQPFGSPVFMDMQQVYSPQQQYPVYPVVSPSWSPTPVPYFETPLAPFQNGGYMNGYRSSGNYKGNALSVNGHRPRSRNQGYAGSSCLVDVAPQAQISGAPIRPPTDALSPTSFNPKDSSLLPPVHNGDGRPRRPNHRGMRRKREDESNTKPLPTAEVKPPPPNFDLAACNFPPLPGSMVTAKEGTALDVCMADVVRGLKVSENKNGSQETKESKPADQPDDIQSKPEAALNPVPVTPEVEPATSCVSESNKDEIEVDSPVSSGDSSLETPVSEEPPTTTSRSASTVSAPSAPSPTSEPEPKKLSYAEVCQRLAKDPPPVQPSPPSAPSPPASESNQPLQELKVNRVQEPRHNSNKHHNEKPRNHQHSRPFRGSQDPERPGPKNRDRPRNFNKSFSGQRGFKRSGKEQNIPPSPK